jgi:hypothetical protein
LDVSPSWQQDSLLDQAAGRATSDSGLSGLRDLKNSITLTTLPAVSSPLARYQLFHWNANFRQTKGAV